MESGSRYLRVALDRECKKGVVASIWPRLKKMTDNLVIWEPLDKSYARIIAGVELFEGLRSSTFDHLESRTASLGKGFQTSRTEVIARHD